MTPRQKELVHFSARMSWLPAADAARAFSRALEATSTERYGLDERRWEITDHWDAVALDAVALGAVAGPAKLASHVTDAEVVVCSGSEDVCRMSRDAFLDHWQDIFLPSRDDVVIMPGSGAWALFYSHEDEFEPGDGVRPAKDGHVKFEQDSEPEPAGGALRKRSGKGRGRTLVLALVGVILVTGSYPVWLRIAERVAQEERARERAKTPSGKRTQAFFGKETITSEGSRWLMSRDAQGLEKLGEAPLDPETDANRECYRFTWLRTFHRPVIFRVEVKGDGGASLTIKVADGAGGYDWGEVVRTETKVLEKTVTQTLRAQARKLLKSDPGEKSAGFDGSYWLMEVLVKGRYRAVCPWSPTEGEVWDMGQLLIDQAPAGPDFTPVY